MVNKCTKKLLIDLGNYDYYREKKNDLEGTKQFPNKITK